MYNKVIILGNLTRDVELRYLPSGSALATIGLASNRRFKKQDGSPGEEVCFVDVKLFGRSAEVANQYLRKGSKVLIEGRLSFETWSDQNGTKRSKHTITAESMQMLDSKSSAENTHFSGDYGSNTSNQQPNQAQNYGGGNYSGGNTQAGNYTQNIPEINIDEDEIPF
ncbi:MAG: single-stranded DNA-binding protein [Helicobacter sp.]|uniref:single-stranded DNA-binding protein n=1 Tax=Helicobacter sp. TaxID=218 RepID=UPI0025C58303|nr:single-stranded DNA-binding protein [Helicobacter sp.]MCH5313063.1 single-stranded DNA-binding protein [Helicobacter sp.]